MPCHQYGSMLNKRRFKKQLDPDAFYLAIQDTFAAFGPPYSVADNKIKWSVIEKFEFNNDELIEKSNVYYGKEDLTT